MLKETGVLGKASDFLNRKIVRLAARWVLGGVFIYASAGKIIHPRDFARIVVNYKIIPDKAAVYVAFLLPWLELACGFLLIVGRYVRISAAALSGLLVVFMAALTIRSFAGPIKACGCFTSAGGSGHGLAFYLIRDILLLGFGALLMKRPAAASVEYR